MGALIRVLWRAVAGLVMLVGIGTLAGCGPDSLSGATMGTRYRVLGEACPDGLPEVRVAAALDEVVQDMSTWVPDSSLSRFNRAPPGEWFGVSADMVRVVAAAAMVSDSTEGAFDVTVAPLVDEYGFGPGSVLADEAVHVDYRLLEFREHPPALRKGGPLRVDVSSIAKGFAVDRVVELLAGVGCTSALVEIGGELRVFGAAPGGGAWRVAIESPGEGFAPGTLILDEGGIATSGDYRQTGERDGTRTTHIIDPRTGTPIDGTLASATVIAPTAMQADALATALMVLGKDALAFAETHHVAALLVFRSEGGFVTRVSPALDALGALAR
ncbi:MAG: FAD:protein FMN transferase [Gammaproteobacteria bacterium]|nr:FAD:protein FMN transferase [Gammaproteobacteria bacterium]